MSLLELSGSFTTTAPASRVIDFISSPESLSTVLPDVEKFSRTGEVSTVRFRLDLQKNGNSTGSGYLSTATATMRFHFEDVRSDGVVIKGEGRTLGNQLKLTVAIAIGEADGETEIDWSASIDTGVLLRLFGSETVNTVSREIVREIIANVERALS